MELLAETKARANGVCTKHWRFEMTMEMDAADKAKDKTITLRVNGRERTVTSKKQSYRDIAKLAYPDADFDKFMFTITYFKGESEKEGDLVEGETINVKDGMVLNVRRSDRS
jgi:Multiubiquitin